MEYKTIQQGEIIILDNRFYKVSERDYSNGEHRGKRPMLILLKEKELSKLLKDEISSKTHYTNINPKPKRKNGIENDLNVRKK